MSSGRHVGPGHTPWGGRTDTEARIAREELDGIDDAIRISNVCDERDRAAGEPLATVGGSRDPDLGQRTGRLAVNYGREVIGRSVKTAGTTREGNHAVGAQGENAPALQKAAARE